MHPNVHSSIIYNCQGMEATEEWMGKMWYIYTMEYSSAIKKNNILPFAATWMDLEGIMLSEILKSEKDKCCLMSLICGI